MTDAGRLRSDALAIWTAAVDAVRPEPLVERSVRGFPPEWLDAIRAAQRVLVIGGGKAGAGMAAGLEVALTEHVEKITGLINVPEGSERSLRRIRLHPARPAGSNHPTAAGVAGTQEMLRLLASAGPDDVAICLLSGGGSALLPAPVEGISLEDKQTITKLLHARGATITEMNAVRKHLSRVKGGRLAEAFRGKLLISLIISDVVGDPLDVIASGPTAPDPTTFADAWAVFEWTLLSHSPLTPRAVYEWLNQGTQGRHPETTKSLPTSVFNNVIGSNSVALQAAKAAAARLGYPVLNLGPFIEGETREVAVAVAGIVRAIRACAEPVRPPVCILFGGETVVIAGPSLGRGGRNQEFVLAALAKLGQENMCGVCVLSGGTDGEDGPTDAAGAIGTEEILRRAIELRLDVRRHLQAHDAYPFFDQTGGLIRTGLTGTNVADVGVILVT